MRKFKIKNRQKRKYTRKNNPTSSMSLERGISAGLLPFLIVAVALFTTMIISHNLREQDLAIEFSFQLPTISTAPLEQFIRDLPILVQQPTAMVGSFWNLLVMYVIGFSMLAASAVTAAMTAVLNGIVQVAILLDPRPLIGFIGQGITLVGMNIASGLTQLFNAVVFAINYIVLSLAAFFVFVGQGIAWAAQTALWALAMICNSILDALIIVTKFLTAITMTVAHAIIIAVQFTIVKVTAFIDALLYFLGTPFRMLAAFWQIIKPYVDVFVQHLQMVGADLNNGFKALNNFSSIIGPTK